MKVLFAVAGLFVLGACASETAQEATTTPEAPAATAPATAGTNPEVHRYRVQSGVVTYALSGVQTGTETLYFDRWGMREAKHTQTEIRAAGVTIRQNQLVVMADGFTTTVDLDKQTGTRIPTPLIGELVEAAQQSGADMTDIGEEMMTRMGAVKVGTETVLDKPCDVWEVKQLNTKTWVWEGVTLRTEVNLAGQRVLTEATAVQENAAVPEDRFTIPAGVQITEGVNPLEQLRNLPGRSPNP
jgi:hypothetical protein